MIDFTSLNFASAIIYKDRNRACIHSPGVMDIEYVDNLSYIYFEGIPEIICNWYQHFIKINEKSYFIDYFCANHLATAIVDRNSRENNILTNEMNSRQYKCINFDKAIILHTFTLCPGHEFAQILYFIYLIKTKNLHDYDIIINKHIFSLGKSIYGILYLFLNNEKIKVVDIYDKVFIKNSIVYYPCTSRDNIYVKHFYNELSCYRIKNNGPKKISFIKTIKNSVNWTPRFFHDSYLTYFESNGYINIDPSNYEVMDLYNLIQNADNLIFTWGSNSWINSSYCGENSRVLILCSTDYSNEYINQAANWLPDTYKKLLFFKDIISNHEICETNRKILGEKMDELDKTY